MLYRDIEIRDDLGIVPDHVQDFERECIRVDVEHPDPEIPGDVGDLPQELREAALSALVGSVGRKVLGYQVDFPDAAGDKGPGFVKDAVHAAGPQASADERDGAEAASVVAAFRYLQVGASGIAEKFLPFIDFRIGVGVFGNKQAGLP